MLIHDIKFEIVDHKEFYRKLCGLQPLKRANTILQNFSQEPSTSSKFHCFPDALIIRLGNCAFEYNSGMTNYLDS